MDADFVPRQAVKRFGNGAADGEGEPAHGVFPRQRRCVGPDSSPREARPASCRIARAQAREVGRKVMVAHCFRYHDGLRKAKRLLDDGRIAGIGTHEELMAASPTYREIVFSQLTEEEIA